MKARHLTALPLALGLLTGAAPAASALPQELEPLWTVEGITEYRLENGLRVLLFPDPSKETFTVNVTYMVGSRHEGRGEKGMAHLLEHMVFKGTDTYENIWGALEDHGARFNGTTWLDRTNYYETLPSSDENLEFALSLEADRMVNSRIAASDLEREFSVVRNEFEMGENQPGGVLMERIVSTAFLWHSYGFSTIGNRSDIERVPAGRLRAFYERYYQPDNALLVLAGRFDEALALDLIQRGFGAIPRPERTLDPTYTVEPVQDGARFVSLQRVASVQAAGVLYHASAGPHIDTAALTVLATILDDEPSGRLYQALVPTGLATSVSSFMWPTAEPGFFMVMCESSLDQDIAAAHERMITTMEALAGEGFTDVEVERGKTKLLKSIRLRMNNSGGIGIQLSDFQAQGDWRLFFIHRDRLKDVTVSDVTDVARRYFLESNRTSGIFTPVDEPLRAEIPTTPDVARIVEGYAGTETIASGETFEPTPQNIEARTERLDLTDGIKLALLQKKTRGEQVVARLRFHYGTEASMKGAQTALAMLPALLMRGTERLGYQELRDEIDRLQSSIGVSGEAGSFEVSITTDRANLDAVLRLTAEILKNPAFPEDQFELLKKETLAELEQSTTDPMRLAFKELPRRFSPFPEGSFHYVPTIEEEIVLTRDVTREQLQELHGRFFGASNAEICLVGDLDADQVKATLTEVLGSWKSPSPYERVSRPFVPVVATRDSIDTPDKEMAVVATGASVRLRDDDPAYPAIQFANYVLGQSAKSRLLNRLRHEGGLSYGAGSMLEVDSQDEVTILAGFAICAPQNAHEAQAAMREEFERWIDDGVTSEELEEGKKSFALKFQGNLADDGFVAGQLARDLEIGRTFEYHAERMQRIEDLTTGAVTETLQGQLSEAAWFEFAIGDMKKVTPGE